MVRLCVFDLDGTLVNSIGDIKDAMNRALEKLGYRTYTEREYCKMVGDGMYLLCKRAIPEKSNEEVEKLVLTYKEDYIKNCCKKTVLYDGIKELIDALNKEKIACAILSNKPHEQVVQIVDKLFSKNLFCKVLGHSDKYLPKPDPMALTDLIESLGYKKEEVAYIGDSDVDIKLGKNAGVFTVGVAWGLRGEEELLQEGAQEIAYDTKDLENILIK